MNKQYHEIGQNALEKGLDVGEKIMNIFSIDEKEIRIDVNITNIHEGIERVKTSTESTGKWSMISTAISNAVMGKIYKELNNNNLTADVSVHVQINKEN